MTLPTSMMACTSPDGRELFSSERMSIEAWMAPSFSELLFASSHPTDFLPSTDRHIPGQRIQRAVICRFIHPPENGLPGISKSGWKLISQQPEQAKDNVAGTCRVRHDLNGIKPYLLLQKPFQHKNGCQGPRYRWSQGTNLRRSCTKWCHALAEKFSIRPGIDRFYRRDNRQLQSY